MHESTLKDRTLAALAVAQLPLDSLELPMRARRRDNIGRLALVVADVASVVLSLLVVSALSGAHFTIWVPILLPFYVLLAKMAGLYDRDQFVLHKTTLDEGPALVAVSAIFTLVVEAVQALQFQGRSHPLLLWGLITVVLLVARGGARFVIVRTTPSERVLIVGDAASAAASGASCAPTRASTRPSSAACRSRTARLRRPTSCSARSTTCRGCSSTTTSSAWSSRRRTRAGRTWST